MGRRGWGREGQGLWGGHSPQPPIFKGCGQCGLGGGLRFFRRIESMRVSGLQNHCSW